MEHDHCNNLICIVSDTYTDHSFCTLYDRNCSNRNRNYLLFEESKKLDAIKISFVCSSQLSVYWYFALVSRKHLRPKHLEIDETLIDLMMTDYNQENVPGAAILIVHQSNIILSKGYGLAKINEGTKINNQTNFRLASITKQFTAMAIMILKQRGQLNYEQTLTEFF